MAVEARHLNLFPPQFTGNREMMNPIQGNGNMYQTEIGYGVPLSGTTTVAEGLLPLYNSTATAAMKSESSLTYNNNVLPLPRKRSRDSINPILSFPSPVQQQSNNNNGNNKTCFLGHDISFHMEQQQLDIDRIISQHMEKMRVEMEERRKRQARKIMEAIEGGVMKKLKAKEEEIEKIGKLNWALEERVKSLCVENQIWRDLAQTNEATTRCTMHNLVAGATGKQQRRKPSPVVEDGSVGIAGRKKRVCCCCRVGICACVRFVGLHFTFAPFVNPLKMLVFMLTCDKPLKEKKNTQKIFSRRNCWIPKFCN
uniref:BOI-related E3 ubiquitin-protein ligase 3 n=1 Tax=Gossypium raimondii TaxID=29730 RepID=A0A0D2R070_GOSRA|nr:hypothetical protein B456_002G036500 [Gossypium raimondii]